MLYIIQNKVNPELYWDKNNGAGMWDTKLLASSYTEAQRRYIKLPEFGQWVQANASKGSSDEQAGS